MSDHEGNAELSVNCVVKGYHECNFEVYTAEEFLATRKRGPRGQAFRVSNNRGQLGHLQVEVVDVFWPLRNCSLSCTVTGAPFNDPQGRWRFGGGINVPITVKTVLTKSKAKEIKRVLGGKGLVCSVQDL